MTTFNLERFVTKALRSVLDMTYAGDKELIIVDDASTDRTPEIIAQVLEESATAWKVDFIRKKENGGVSAAVDTGFSHATKDWIIFIDGDDVQNPQRAERTAELIMRYPQAVMITMSAELIDAEDFLYGKMPYADCGYDNSPDVLYLDTPEKRVENYIHIGGLHIRSYGCAMAISRSLYLKWGNLCNPSTKVRFAQDPTWELRAILSGPVIGSKYFACRYRTHNSNILNRTWGDGADGIADMELFHARYQAFDAATFRKKLEDLQRSECENDLSDCTESHRLRIHSYISKELEIAEMRSNWWYVSWPVRLMRALRSIGKLPPHMKYWPWWRLLPLRLFALAKSKR